MKPASSSAARTPARYGACPSTISTEIGRAVSLSSGLRLSERALTAAQDIPQRLFNARLTREAGARTEAPAHARATPPLRVPLVTDVEQRLPGLGAA